MEGIANWRLPGAAHSNLLVVAAVRRTGEKPLGAGQLPGAPRIMREQPVSC
jgi:hypothetical protein